MNTTDEILTEVPRQSNYEEQYIHFPFFIVFISLINLGFFLYYAVAAKSQPFNSLFAYRPDKLHQIWRFVCYMFLHYNWEHLFSNVLVQVFVGIPLELVHGSLRVGTVYVAGVIAGSLSLTAFSSYSSVIGASGGVFAVVGVTSQNIIFNYKSMELGLFLLIGMLLCVGLEILISVYVVYFVEVPGPHATHILHASGGLVGIAFGFFILNNGRHELYEEILWVGAFGTYLIYMLFLIVVYGVYNAITS